MCERIIPVNGKVEVKSQLSQALFPEPRRGKHEHKLFSGSLHTPQGSELSLAKPVTQWWYQDFQKVIM